MVISDRFADSTRMYQGVFARRSARGGGQLHALMVRREPDLTFVIDMDPETGLAGARGRNGTEERFEDFGAGLQRRMRAGFGAGRRISRPLPVIDGARPAEAVARDVAAAADRALGMSEAAIAEPDRVEGAPHPRDTLRLVGQGAAEDAFLDACRAGRLHHAWLLTGPLGVGKATLAWRIARFLLATPEDRGGGLFGAAPAVPQSLDIYPDDPVARRIHAGSEGLSLVLRRAWTKRMRGSSR